jgi:hypothetical protein
MAKVSLALSEKILECSSRSFWTTPGAFVRSMYANWPLSAKMCPKRETNHTHSVSVVVPWPPTKSPLILVIIVSTLQLDFPGVNILCNQ